jgi:hypothetical protein
MMHDKDVEKYLRQTGIKSKLTAQMYHAAIPKDSDWEAKCVIVWRFLIVLHLSDEKDVGNLFAGDASSKSAAPFLYAMEEVLKVLKGTIGNRRGRNACLACLRKVHICTNTEQKLQWSTLMLGVLVRFHPHLRTAHV